MMKNPPTKPKLYHGHYTSYFNNECIVVCSLLQGRDIIQVVLLLFKVCSLGAAAIAAPIPPAELVKM